MHRHASPACRCLAILATLTALLATAATGEPRVGYDQRSFIINGSRTLILSGAVHYPRLLPSDWAKTFELAKQLNLNTIQTYVMWNFHEHKKGEMVWSGRADLRRYVAEAHAAGLYVSLRIGPYICGEYYFGGIPLWMRHQGNISCMRCDDPDWEAQMQRFVTQTVEQVKDMLYPDGPIIMLQIENEYGGFNDYLTWSVSMARNITTQVPWNLCHDELNCAKVNAQGLEVLCTINGFWMEQHDSFVGQPSPAWLGTHFQENPKQPGFWTEDQGWFDQWGVGQRVRWSSDQAYGVMRFFAYGGSAHNHYMLTGGNNYGLQAGGDVVTAYAPDTVIDYLGLAHQPRFDFYSEMYGALEAVSETMLQFPVAKATQLVIHSGGHDDTASTDPTPILAARTCYQYSDNTQEWNFENGPDKFGTLSLSGTLAGLCLSDSSVKNPTLVKCASGSADQQFMYNSSAQEIASQDELPCRKRGQTGKCHQCVDKDGGSSTIDLWDCKAKSDPEIDNQLWTYDSTTKHLVDKTGDCLTYYTPPKPFNGTGAEAHQYGPIVFLSNYMELRNGSGVVQYNGTDFFMTNHSVLLLDYRSGGAKVVFNTSNIDDAAYKAGRTLRDIPLGEWSGFQEPVDGARNVHVGPGIVEQLTMTDNDSDYAWFSTNVSTARLLAAGSVRVSGSGGSLSYVYVDGKLMPAASSAGDEAEFRLTAEARDALLAKGPGATTSDIQVFSCAMGMYNGGMEPSSRKGPERVSVGGVDVSNQTWKSSWLLLGESLNITGDPSRVAWKPAASFGGADTLVWFKAGFDLPADLARLREQSPSQPLNLSVALDLSGLSKGGAYVNGFHLGRYSMQPGECSGDCAPPHHGSHCYIHWKACGEPTQTLYHIPFSVLQPTGNTIVLFEETAKYQPSGRDFAAVRVVALTQHPTHD